VKIRTAFTIHKQAGLITGFVLGLLAFTGFFLDHENFNFLWSITVADEFVPQSMVDKKGRGYEVYKVDPSDPVRIFAGGRRGLFLSGNAGADYSLVLDKQVFALEPERTGDLENYKNLFAATADGIYTSTDAGLHWILLGLKGKAVESFSVHDQVVHAVVDKRDICRLGMDGAVEKLDVGPVSEYQLPDKVSLSRLVRDLHYGRGLFSGDSSILINDFASIALLFLSIGGYVIYYYIRKIKQRSKVSRGKFKLWVSTHSNGWMLLCFIPLSWLLITGVLLDHSQAFRSFMSGTIMNTAYLPPVYRDLSTDIWGMDFDGSHYRIGNRLGVFESTNLHDWVLETEGFAWRLKRTGKNLYTSGMGTPNSMLTESGWEKLPGTPHMPRDFFLDNGEVKYFTWQSADIKLPVLATTSLYHILLGLHDGELLWGQWVWINDISVIGAVLLLVTGYSKWRRKRNQKPRSSTRED